MERAKELQDCIDNFSKKAFGRSLTDSQKANTCVFCNKLVTEFRDSLSQKEYEISGLCQECQDQVFGE